MVVRLDLVDGGMPGKNYARRWLANGKSGFNYYLMGNKYT